VEEGGPARCVTQAGIVVCDALGRLESEVGGKITCLIFGQMDEWDIMGRYPEVGKGMLILDVALTLPFKVLWSTRGVEGRKEDGWHPTRAQVFEAMRIYQVPSFLLAYFDLCSTGEETRQEVHHRVVSPGGGFSGALEAIEEIWQVTIRFAQQHHEILDECALTILARSAAVRLLNRKVATASRAGVARISLGQRGEDALRDNLCGAVACARGSHSKGKSTKQFWVPDAPPLPTMAGMAIREGDSASLGVLSVVHLEYGDRVVLPESFPTGCPRAVRTEPMTVPGLVMEPAEAIEEPAGEEEEMELEGDLLAEADDRSESPAFPLGDGLGGPAGSDPPRGDAPDQALSPFPGEVLSRVSTESWASQVDEAEAAARLEVLSLGSTRGEPMALPGTADTSIQSSEVFVGPPLGESRSVPQHAVDDHLPAGSGGEDLILGVLTSQTPPSGQPEGQGETDSARSTVESDGEGTGGSDAVSGTSADSRKASLRSSRGSPRGSPGTVRRSTRKNQQL
jgi:hypothetical protein